MSTTKFWLDGGYDRELVEACRLHPNHEWVTLDLREVDSTDSYAHLDPRMTVCRVCGVPRCGESDLDGCELPRHHEEAHRTRSGAGWPIGGTDPRPRREPRYAEFGVWS